MAERELYPLYYFVEDVFNKTAFFKKLMKLCNYANFVIGIILCCTFFDKDIVRPHSMKPCQLEYVWIISIIVQYALGSAAIIKKRVKIWNIYIAQSFAFVDLPLFAIFQYYLSKPIVQIKVVFPKYTFVHLIEEYWEELKLYCSNLFISHHDDALQIISPFMIYWCSVALTIQIITLYTGYRLMILRKIKNNVFAALHKRNTGFSIMNFLW